eukprot:GHUV01044159.1.p1 GENE.GHUV01044159.1~~GHUV01044159.1.p1  ORF type:complete len:107 (+),score=8.09 GHUV01044159.1:369-689(+)
MGVLFRSALLTRSCDSSGDVSTLMAVDTGRLANICVSFHELWSLPLQIAAAMWLLYTQVGNFCKPGFDLREIFTLKQPMKLLCLHCKPCACPRVCTHSITEGLLCV